MANTHIAKGVGVSLPTVLLWRSCFVEHGVDGLVDAPHPGRPRVYGREVSDKIVAETRVPPAEPMTHWSRARLAARVGVSASTVGRVWREANLKAHRSETVKYSRDPELVEKVTHEARERHTGADFLAFLKCIARSYPMGARTCSWTAGTARTSLARSRRRRESLNVGSGVVMIGLAVKLALSNRH